MGEGSELDVVRGRNTGVVLFAESISIRHRTSWTQFDVNSIHRPQMIIDVSISHWERNRGPGSRTILQLFGLDHDTKDPASHSSPVSQSSHCVQCSRCVVTYQVSLDLAQGVSFSHTESEKAPQRQGRTGERASEMDSCGVCVSARETNRRDLRPCISHTFPSPPLRSAALRIRSAVQNQRLS